MAPLSALIYLAADVMEDLVAATLISLGGGVALSIWLLGLLSLVKWIALAAAAMPLLLVAIAMREQASHFFRDLRHRLMALRAQLLVMAVATLTLLAVGGDIGTQVEDVVLRWAEDQWHAFFAIAAALILSILMALTGFLCVGHYMDSPPPARKPLTLRFL